MGGEDHSQLGECVRCQRIVPVSPDRVCRSCRALEEREIARLTSAWGADLDLLARFEAYCVRRAVARAAIRQA
jgi:hypothetical protein